MGAMKYLTTLAGISLTAAAVAVNAARDYHEILPRQDGIIDPSTASDCTFFETVHDISQNCQHWETTWSISHADFIEWNPSTKFDCSGLQVGNSYCVEVNYGVPRPDEKSSSTKQTKITESPKPRPTQPGLVQDCTMFYKAKPGDTCNKIVAAHATFTFERFLNWNPSVGETCASLLANYYYCVGSSSSPPPKVELTTGPSPTQSGIAKDCTAFYKVNSGDTCQGIVDKYGTFVLDSFYKWNPAVGQDCQTLLADFHVCVGVLGGALTEQPKPSSASPTQDGIIKTCNGYYQAVSGDTCQRVVDKHGGSFNLDDL